MIPEPQQPDYFLDSFPRYVWAERPNTLPVAVSRFGRPCGGGQQGGLPLTVEQSLRIYDLLCAFTGDSGAIRQAEFFVYRPSERAALEGVLERYRRGAPIEPTTWIRASAKDVALIRSLGVRETGMLASASDYHTFHKFKPGGRNQAAQTYLRCRARDRRGGDPPTPASGSRHPRSDGLHATVHRSSTGNLSSIWRQPATQVSGVRHDGAALRRG